MEESKNCAWNRKAFQEMNAKRREALGIMEEYTQMEADREDCGMENGEKEDNMKGCEGCKDLVRGDGGTGELYQLLVAGCNKHDVYLTEEHIEEGCQKGE